MNDYENKITQGTLEDRFKYTGAIQTIIMKDKIFDTETNYHLFMTDRIGKDMTCMVRTYDKQTKKQTAGVNLNYFLSKQPPEKYKEFEERLKKYIG